MKLEDWIKKDGRSKYRIAKDLGVQWTTLWRWLTGRSVPNPDMMVKVAEFTGNKVTPNDWLGVSKK